MYKNLRLAVLALAGLSVVGAGPAFSQGKPPIKIGNITFMSGPAASAGLLLDAMADLAVEDINASGGINGSMVVKQTEDAQTDPAQAVLMYRKLAAEGAVATLGPSTGTQWQTVAAKLERIATEGLFDTFFAEFNFGDLPEADLMRSIRLFGTEVMPRLRDFSPF